MPQPFICWKNAAVTRYQKPDLDPLKIKELQLIYNYAERNKREESSKMSVGVFTDKKHHPTETEILEAIGSKLSMWKDLIRFIRENYPAQEDFKFLYGKNYGWGLRFRIKGQLLTSLYPGKDGFSVQVNLSPEAIEKAQSMKLGQSAQQVIDRAHPYPEGRWLFIPIESEKDICDIKQLLALRVETKGL